MIELEQLDSNLLIYIVLFIGVLVAYEGLQQLLFRNETDGEARNRRMKMIKGGASSDEVLQLLRDPAMVGEQGKIGPIKWLKRLIIQSGLSISPGLFVVGILALCGITFFVAQMFIPPDLALGASIAGAMIVPLGLLSVMKGVRLKKLTNQLPDALDLMARGLKVGHPVAVTVGNVATDMPDPIGTEFGIIQDQINYGDDVATAFHDFAKRVETEDAHYLAVSVGIQHGTGGNLSRILNVLSTVVRDRRIMHKKIKAISAEGRLSGMILTALPILIYATIELSSPAFYGDVRSDPMFPIFAITIVGLVVAQGLILYKLVSFKF